MSGVVEPEPEPSAPSFSGQSPRSCPSRSAAPGADCDSWIGDADRSNAGCALDGVVLVDAVLDAAPLDTAATSAITIARAARYSIRLPLRAVFSMFSNSFRGGRSIQGSRWPRIGAVTESWLRGRDARGGTVAAMPKQSLWSDEQSGHSWLPAPEPAASGRAAPTEEHAQRPSAVSRVGFRIQLVVACAVGAVAGALVELLR